MNYSNKTEWKHILNSDSKNITETLPIYNIILKIIMDITLNITLITLHDIIFR